MNADKVPMVLLCVALIAIGVGIGAGIVTGSLLAAAPGVAIGGVLALLVMQKKSRG